MTAKTVLKLVRKCDKVLLWSEPLAAFFEISTDKIISELESLTDSNEIPCHYYVSNTDNHSNIVEIG